MSARRGRRAALVALPFVSACAWSDPDSRPIWNTFEEQVVPTDDALFVATLPLTVPIGVTAIAADTCVAHPVQVLDDAARDAGELWDGERMDFEAEYYTQLASLPLRVAFTPVVFGGAWVLRILFDVPAHAPDLSDAERQAAEEVATRDAAARERVRREARVAAFMEWLQAGAARASVAPELEGWDARLDAALRRALDGDAAERLTLHLGMLRCGMTQIGAYDASVALADPDPVLRFRALEQWPVGVDVPARLRNALRGDPFESIRLLAQQRFRR